MGCGTPSDDCDSVRIKFSGLRVECPIAPGSQLVARKPDYHVFPDAVVHCNPWFLQGFAIALYVP